VTSNSGPASLKRRAFVCGAESGLRWIDRIAVRADLDQYHLLHAARADLLRRAGRCGEARTAYEKAIALATNRVERRYLEQRLTALGTVQAFNPARVAPD